MTFDPVSQSLYSFYEKKKKTKEKRKGVGRKENSKGKKRKKINEPCTH